MTNWDYLRYLTDLAIREFGVTLTLVLILGIIIVRIFSKRQKPNNETTIKNVQNGGVVNINNAPTIVCTPVDKLALVNELNLKELAKLDWNVIECSELKNIAKKARTGVHVGFVSQKFYLPDKKQQFIAYIVEGRDEPLVSVFTSHIEKVCPYLIQVYAVGAQSPCWTFPEKHNKKQENEISTLWETQFKQRSPDAVSLLN